MAGTGRGVDFLGSTPFVTIKDPKSRLKAHPCPSPPAPPPALGGNRGAMTTSPGGDSAGCPFKPFPVHCHVAATLSSSSIVFPYSFSPWPCLL